MSINDMTTSITATDRLETDDLRDELAPATARWLDFLAAPTHGNAMIYGPTQMGKTAASHVFVRKCMDSGVPVIISTDNRTDQLDQFYSRFRDAFACDTTTTILRVADRRFRREAVPVLRGNRRLIVFLLNNAPQIDALRDAMREAMIADNPMDNLRLPKVVILHDEGDVVTKDPNVKRIEQTQAASHRAWLRVVDLLGSRSVLKRAFLTATPENVVYLHDVERVIRLPIPKTSYVGWRDLRFHPIPDDVNEAPLRALVAESRRVERGAVLFCTDRVIEDGHDEMFRRICREVKPPSIVHTYNGKGIMARCNHPGFVAMVEAVGAEMGLRLKLEKIPPARHVHRIVGMPVSHFYEVCRRLKTYRVITIGMDLMSRGISFVSSGIGDDVKDTIAATTMIYTPGATMHAVGLVQAIGRITGKACPDLERRLFAPQRVIDDYLRMMCLQTEYLNKIEDTTNTREDMAQIHHRYRLSGSLDRIKLGLKPKYAQRCFKIDVEKHNARAQERLVRTKKAMATATTTERIDGVDVAWLKTQLKGKGNLIRKIVEVLKGQDKPITIEELRTKAKIEMDKMDLFDDTLEKGCSSPSNTKGAYGKIWIIEDQKVVLNPNLRNKI